MKIGSFETENDLFLAPMAGYTNIAFREQCKKFGAGLTTTEMISAKGLIYDSEKTKELLYTSSLETPKVVQIFGHEPQVMFDAIRHPALEQFDIIDINMGCPAPKITKNGEGSFLMTKPELAAELVKSCVSASNRPVTVKMRIGYDEDNSVLFAKEIERAGASVITVHGRLKSQGYSGKANYEAIALVKKAVDIPVVANGDVVDISSYEIIKEITHADAVMIGRAAVGNPHIFAEILGLDIPFDKFSCIKEQFELLLKFYDERYVVTNMRKQIVHVLKGHGLSNETKLAILSENSAEKVIDMLENILN